MNKIIIGMCLLIQSSLTFAAASPSSTCETPASIACIYGFTPQVSGCPIASTVTLPNGGWGAIALVDSGKYGAGDSAVSCNRARDDLNTFSAQYNLPTMNASNWDCIVLDDAGTNSCTDATSGCGEIALDIEWSHAMAPNAKIILVLAKDASIEERMKAVRRARDEVYNAGGGLVSMSFSYDEFANESDFDHNFIKDGVVFIGSSGDYCAPPRYPATSPNVIAAGSIDNTQHPSPQCSQFVVWFV